MLVTEYLYLFKLNLKRLCYRDEHLKKQLKQAKIIRDKLKFKF